MPGSYTGPHYAIQAKVALEELWCPEQLLLVKLACTLSPIGACLISFPLCFPSQQTPQASSFSPSPSLPPTASQPVSAIPSPTLLQPLSPSSLLSHVLAPFLVSDLSPQSQSQFVPSQFPRPCSCPLCAQIRRLRHRAVARWCEEHARSW